MSPSQHTKPLVFKPQTSRLPKTSLIVASESCDHVPSKRHVSSSSLTLSRKSGEQDQEGFASKRARARERDQQGFDFLYCSHTALMMEEVAICALRATRVTRDEETGFRSEKFSFRHSFVLLLQFLHDFLGVSPFSPLSNPSPSC